MAEVRATGATRRTILVVDDEPIVLSFLGNALGRVGYDVITATDATQARSLFDQHSKSLVLMAVEIALRDTSGPEFIGSLPVLKPRIPVLFLTAFGEYEVPLQCFDFQSVILRKPFTTANLTDTIQKVALAIK